MPDTNETNNETPQSPSRTIQVGDTPWAPGRAAPGPFLQGQHLHLQHIVTDLFCNDLANDLANGVVDLTLN